MTGHQQSLSASQSVAQAMRDDHALLLSCLIRQLGDFQLAEDCLQDAMASALVHWKRNGTPRSPAAWLLQVARRKAIDRLRREKSFRSKSTDYTLLIAEDENSAGEESFDIPDERLRLVFTCCHPALDPKSRIALTLNTLCGMKTEEVARAFLDSRQTMAQRLVRAKSKIRNAAIPYSVPEPDEWPARLNTVLDVIYLIFNEGYVATSGSAYLRPDLSSEAIRLARLVNDLCPSEPEIEGLLALLILQDSRRVARLSAHEVMIPLDEQDRSLWDAGAIAEGVALVETALARKRPGSFQLQAAIAALHAESPSHAQTDWRQIVLLYDELLKFTENPVVRLNRAVAVSYDAGVWGGLELLEDLAIPLDTYQPFHAARADMLLRAGDRAAAQKEFRRAIQLSGNALEKAFLARRLNSADDL